MKLEVEGKAPVEEVREPQIVRAIRALKSYGPSSYASLTDSNGNYIQVAGGGVSCMIEYYEAKGTKRSRAFHDKPNPTRPDGTILAFRAGNIPMRSDEWFTADQVIAVFVSFLNAEQFPDFIHWRDAPGF
ncbi:hypothetical protein [Burkholderia contaminans]|uniref:hypothetical protein n=1 Tax=Burkholderia contaminans TaxID=488447 RepID=UPI001CF4CD85|nr:hypothetical protein [Burkholderia contaminans]MCA8095969.1 hypothetical protein [Burkholderia contaminans]